MCVGDVGNRDEWRAIGPRWPDPNSWEEGEAENKENEST